MASEATKMAVRSNMHLDDMVIEVTEFNSEVRADLRGHYHCCTLVFRAIALLFPFSHAATSAMVDNGYDCMDRSECGVNIWLPNGAVSNFALLAFFVYLYRAPVKSLSAVARSSDARTETSPESE